MQSKTVAAISLSAFSWPLVHERKILKCASDSPKSNQHFCKVTKTLCVETITISCLISHFEITQIIESAFPLSTYREMLRTSSGIFDKVLQLEPRRHLVSAANIILSSTITNTVFFLKTPTIKTSQGFWTSGCCPRRGCFDLNPDLFWLCQVEP